MPVLVLNPGQMGSAVAAALVDAGHDVMWVSAGRSAESHARAEAVGLRAVGSLADALAVADAVVSVVPPAEAVATARLVAATDFSGLYVDANAVSPASAGLVGEALSAAGADSVDGGIIGPPPKTRGDARLYLAGPQAQAAADLFQGSRMDARVVDLASGSTAASALKMAYAGWTKASSALLLAVRAMARAEGVEGALLDEWAISQPQLEAKSDGAARGNAHKAWRFVGEMHEIADTMAGAGLPDGFHRGAAELWTALESFKGQEDATPQAVLDQLAKAAGSR